MNWSLIEAILTICFGCLVLFIFACINDEYDKLECKINMLNQKIEELINKEN